MANKTKESKSSEASWRSLTWDDLDAWTDARSRERGRSYQRSGHVRDLARSQEGKLVAWVQGQERYATTAELLPSAADRFVPSSRCTCPLGIDGCKHGVALVLAYLDALKKGEQIPTASATDRRWRLLKEASAEGMETTAEEFEDEEEDDDYEEEVTIRRGRRRRLPHAGARPSGTGKPKEEVSAYLEGLPAAELTTYILELADRYPDVARELKNRAVLARGDTAALVRQARKEIRRLTAEPAWRNHWTDEGELPDYSGLRVLLQQLRQGGQADALLELGESLFESGLAQIEMSHDEGETASGIADCLEVVFAAVPESSLPDARKLLYVIDMVLRDGYEICHGTEAVLDRPWPAETWSEVTEELITRLKDSPELTEDTYYERFERDRLTGWLIHSLTQAGRTAEILPLYEREARLTGSYERLVAHLIEAKRLEDARRWAQEGIERTRQRYPGIANHLRERIRQLDEQAGDWHSVAAVRAEEFFSRPSLHALDELQKAADKAGCGPQVRAAAMHFLETGARPKFPRAGTTQAPARRPTRRKATVAIPASPAWPLPIPADSLLTEKASFEERPHWDVLLNLALVEHRPDEILRWYDQLHAQRRSRSYGWYGADSLTATVAEAVTEAYPERAAELYQQLIEDYVAQTNTSAYEAAAPHLRKLRDLLQRLSRPDDWTAFVQQLRASNRRKRRFLEVLDRLDCRRIVDG
jgi:uncharacterized Zn finger protein